MRKTNHAFRGFIFGLSLSLTGLALAAPRPPRQAPANQNPGLALTPPMGWNSWNHYAGRVNQRVARQTADAMVASGMAKAGYIYLNLDATWMARQRDAQGRLQANPRRFSQGIPALAAYVHKLGLKFGVYEDAGLRTCAGYPGSFGHYRTDAATFAAWGVDYLKFDWCNVPLRMTPPMSWHLGLNGKRPGQIALQLYRRMGAALLATHRPIVFSLCEWGLYRVWHWGQTAGNLWRTTGDIRDTWASMTRNGFSQNRLAAYSGPGHWNDPDMLEIGNGGMSNTEYRTQMSLWSMLAAPLLAGNDVSKMTPATRAILENRAVIAVDQDALGVQGHRIWRAGRAPNDREIWSKPLTGGAVAVGLFNRGPKAASMTVRWWQLGLGGKKAPVCYTNLWTHQSAAGNAHGFSGTVPSHGVIMLRAWNGANCH